MERLFEGVRRFYSRDFPLYRDLFEELGNSQKPHTLFICCSDSRIDPALITGTSPGELFTVRNVANFVPYYSDRNEFLSTTSSIEYAINALEVSNIIVCGHSCCGGCKALFCKKSELKNLPHTRKWLKLAENVLKNVERDPELMKDSVKRECKTEQLNIVEQMDHLLTYPFIKEKVDRNELNILGWYYVIETGEIFNYLKDKQTFIKIE